MTNTKQENKNEQTIKLLVGTLLNILDEFYIECEGIGQSMNTRYFCQTNQDSTYSIRLTKDSLEIKYNDATLSGSPSDYIKLVGRFWIFKNGLGTIEGTKKNSRMLYNSRQYGESCIVMEEYLLKYQTQECFTFLEAVQEHNPEEAQKIALVYKHLLPKNNKVNTPKLIENTKYLPEIDLTDYVEDGEEYEGYDKGDIPIDNVKLLHGMVDNLKSEDAALRIASANQLYTFLQFEYFDTQKTIYGIIEHLDGDKETHPIVKNILCSVLSFRADWNIVYAYDEFPKGEDPELHFEDCVAIYVALIEQGFNVDHNMVRLIESMQYLSFLKDEDGEPYKYPTKYIEHIKNAPFWTANYHIDGASRRFNTLAPGPKMLKTQKDLRLLENLKEDIHIHKQFATDLLLESFEHFNNQRKTDNIFSEFFWDIKKKLKTIAKSIDVKLPKLPKKLGELKVVRYGTFTQSTGILLTEGGDHTLKIDDRIGIEVFADGKIGKKHAIEAEVTFDHPSIKGKTQHIYNWDLDPGVVNAYYWNFEPQELVAGDWKITVSSPELENTVSVDFKIKTEKKTKPTKEEKDVSYEVQEDNGKFILKGNNGSEFEYNKQTSFDFAKQFPNNTILVKLENEASVIILPNGGLFEYDDEHQFEGVEHYPEDFYTITIYENLKIILTPDLKVLECDGEELFTEIHLFLDERRLVIVRRKDGLLSIISLKNGVLSHNGETGFRDLNPFEDGSVTLMVNDGEYILKEKNGALFTYNGSTEFNYIARFNDGSTAITKGENTKVVEKDGSIFEFKTQTDFVSVTRLEHGTLVELEGGKHGFKFTNGTILKYKGQEVFSKIVLQWNNALNIHLDNGKKVMVLSNEELVTYNNEHEFDEMVQTQFKWVLILLENNKAVILKKGIPFEYKGIKEFDNLRPYKDGITKGELEIDGIERSILIKPDGSLFTCDTQDNFSNIVRYEDGRTKIILDNESQILIKADGELFSTPDGCNRFNMIEIVDGNVVFHR